MVPVFGCWSYGVDRKLHCGCSDANPDKCYQVIASGRNRNRAKQKFAAYWEDDSFSFIEMDVTQTVQENLEGQTNEKACSYLLEGWIISLMLPVMPALISSN